MPIVFTDGKRVIEKKACFSSLGCETLVRFIGKYELMVLNFGSALHLAYIGDEVKR